jgi:Ca2+-binding EF-hand superfamily protein
MSRACPPGSGRGALFLRPARRNRAAAAFEYADTPKTADRMKGHPDMKTAIFAGTIGMIVIGALAGAVMAREHGQTRPSFAALDGDGDGQLTKQELSAHRAARLAQLDTDGDGTITRDELIAPMMQQATRRADRMMDRMDGNKDGQLSPDEMMAAQDGARMFDRMFDRMDSNEDGTISSAEFAAMDHKRQRGGHGKWGGGHGAGAGHDE